MSSLSTFLKFPNSSSAVTPIGDIVPVLVNSFNVQSTICNGTYVKSGDFYSKTEYPKLFELVGQIILNPAYDTANLFYVPIITHTNKINVSFTPATSHSTGQILYYVKGKETGNTPLSSFAKTINYSTSTQIANTILSDTSIRSNNTYLRADYPDLFNQLGSINARAWTPRTVGTTTALQSVSYGNNLYVTAGVNGIIRTSTDTVTWDARTSGTTSTLNTVQYGNSLYVVAGNGGALRSSTDGITWETRTSGTASQINALIYENGIFVYGGVGGVLATSTDIITWVARTSGTASQITDLIYANGLYVITGVGGMLSSSTDTVTWTARTTGTTTSIFALTYGNGIYVIGGNGGFIRTSTDTVTWTARTSGTTSTIYGLTYSSGIYAYVGINGTHGTSTDGITWLSRGTGSGTIAEIKYLNDLYVFVGASGSLSTSTNLTVMSYSPTYDASTQFFVPLLQEYTITGVTGTPSITPITYIRSKY
jgi:hypothetical protein